MLKVEVNEMRATSILVFALAVAVTLPLSARQQAPGAQAQLQAAINKETVEGDLKAAIEMYRRLADAPGDRAVAAKALLRMGVCYEKFGSAESQKAFERILAYFADQKDAVVEARKHLAATAGGARPETGLVERRVWSYSPDDEPIGISADGRFIAVVGVTSNSLLLHDLVTGEDKTVAAKDLCWPAALSADARQIACPAKNVTGGYELRLLRTDGAPARTVPGGTELLVPDDWSPDGKYILARTFKRGGPTADPSSDMVLVSVADGSMKVLKSGGGVGGRVGDRYSTPRFSPDGNYIVHPAARSGPDGKAIANLRDQKGTLHLMRVDGGGEVALVQGAPAEQDWSPVWTPDGRRIVFLSDRSGATALWAVEVRDGRPQGDPELLRASSGEITPMGFSRDGTLFSQRSASKSDVWVAEVEPGTGEILSQPTRVNQTFVGSSGGPAAWSADGRSLAYYRLQDSRRRLVVRTMATGEERELGEYASLVAGWFPDGQSLLAGRNRIDVKTGRVEPIAGLERVSSVYYPGTYVAVSHDGKTFYYSVNDNDRNNGLVTVHLMRRRVDTGEEQDLYQAKSPLPNGIHSIAVSPDDRQVAFGETHRDAIVVKVIPSEGGQARELFGKSNWGVAWSKDSRYLLVRGLLAGRDNQKSELVSVPVDGGPIRPTGLELQAIPLAAHPDGRRIAYQTAASVSEIVAMKNLLPEAKAGR
jgi:Tol biopolymer transport system component